MPLCVCWPPQEQQQHNLLIPPAKCSSFTSNGGLVCGTGRNCTSIDSAGQPGVVGAAEKDAVITADSTFPFQYYDT